MKPDNLHQHENEVKKTASLLNDVLINVDISNVLTPVDCAFLVNEIFQGLLYQKSQIPYPYSWLKSLVKKKQKCEKSEETTRTINFSAANHFRVVSTAYNVLENVMKGIVAEFKEKGDEIREVLFVFGVTPYCPTEIYSIQISSLMKGHLEVNHAQPVSKDRQNILRNIFLSQDWLDAIDNSMVCTNTYIFLKMSTTCSTTVNASDSFFIPTRPLTFPTKTKHIKIVLNCDHIEKRDCCEGFFVFEDVLDVSECHLVKEKQDSENKETQDTIFWCQSKDIFKGFKDCYINKVPASELW